MDLRHSSSKGNKSNVVIMIIKFKWIMLLIIYLREKAYPHD